MKATVALSLGLLAVGCAGGGRVADVPAPPTAQSVEYRPPVQVWSPEPIAAVELEETPARFDEECATILTLVDAGEHKIAVDTLDALHASDAECDPLTLERAEDSRWILEDADELIREGLEARDSGDLETARRRFRQARVVYPRYYWIDALEEELESRVSGQAVDSGEMEERLIEAAALKAAGRYEDALQRLEAAVGGAEPSEALESEIATLKTELGNARLAAAQRAQRAGDLELATELVLSALALAPAQPVRAQVVEFTRRLGLTHFSSGELGRAHLLWNAALALDSENELLSNYVKEVEARLRSLDAIKSDRGE